MAEKQSKKKVVHSTCPWCKADVVEVPGYKDKSKRKKGNR